MLVDASRQRFDTQIYGHDVPILLVCFLYGVDKGRVIVSACISTDGHLLVACRWGFGKTSNDRRIGLVLLATPTPSRQQDRVTFHPYVHGGVAEGEELM